MRSATECMMNFTGFSELQAASSGIPSKVTGSDNFSINNAFLRSEDKRGGCPYSDIVENP
jgi:hypothetical protein